MHIIYLTSEEVGATINAYGVLSRRVLRKYLK